MNDNELREVISECVREIRESGLADTDERLIYWMHEDDRNTMQRLGAAIVMATNRRILGKTIEHVVEHEVTLARNGTYHVIST